MSSVVQPLTAAAYWTLRGEKKFQELIQGEVIESMPPGGFHGLIAVNFAALLKIWSRPSGGFVGVESGYLLERDPDTVRGPDVSYVRADRIPQMGIPVAFWELAPDLAVEIISPSETAESVHEKVRDFLRAKTPLVVVVYPAARELVAHTPDGRTTLYTSEQIFENAQVLPGFQLNVGELFV